MYCKFGEMLEDMLCDQIICRVLNFQIQRRLLTLLKQLNCVSQLNQQKEPQDYPITERYCSSTPYSKHMCCAFKQRIILQQLFKRDIHCTTRACRSHQTNVNWQKTERNSTNRPNTQPHSVKKVGSTEAEEEQPDPVYNLFNLNNKQSTNPVKLSLTVHGQSLVMEVDTAVSLSLISKKTYLSVWADSNSPPPQLTSTCSQTYTSKRIPVLGSFQVEVLHHSQTKRLFACCQGTRSALLGRDWMNVLTLDWHTIHYM